MLTAVGVDATYFGVTEAEYVLAAARCWLVRVNVTVVGVVLVNR